MGSVSAKETTMPFHYNETIISEDPVTTCNELKTVLERYIKEHPREIYIGTFLKESADHCHDSEKPCFFETAMKEGPHYLFTDDYHTIWILGPYGLRRVPIIGDCYVFQLWRPHYFTAAVVNSAVKTITTTSYGDDKIPRIAFDICEGIIFGVVDNHRSTHSIRNTTFISFSATRTIACSRDVLSPRGREVLSLLRKETCRIRLDEPGATFVVHPLGYNIEVSPESAASSESSEAL